MPTQLILSYTAYVYVNVPNDIARKMENGTIDWWSKWGDIYYKDEKGEIQKIVGKQGETDYKRHDHSEWDREEESDGEEESEEEEDCLAGNPKCVKCKIHLSEDDMAVWTEDTTKDPMCEHCLDEEEEKSDSE
jgi:hypothetical protein